MLHYLDKKYTLLFLLTCFALHSIAQTPSRLDRKLFNRADKLFYIAEYYKAMSIYDSLYVVDSTNHELNYKLGLCKFELKKYRKSSLRNFEKVSTLSFPETNFYLGVLNHANKKYKTAIDYFNEYKNLKLSNLEHDVTEIDALIEKCYTARLFDLQQNSNITLENLGAAINTDEPEYAPFIPADEKFLIFTSRNKNKYHTLKDAYDTYYEDVFVSKNMNGVWGNATPLDTLINTQVHDASAGLSANGEKMILFRTSSDLMSGDIYESNWINNEWSEPVSLGYLINTFDHIESSACYSPDGNTIIFSSNKPGGIGGFDLYASKKGTNGSWSYPDNLGSTINTEYNEDSPFIDPLGKTLYFSSEGHTNMGGYDVFKVPYSDNVKFNTKPENLGTPINTVNDDIFFVINANGSKGYIASERDGGFGSQDIYSINFKNTESKLKAYNIHALDSTNTIVNNVQITITEKGKKAEKSIFKSNTSTGKVLLLCNPTQKFDVAIESYGLKTIVLDDYNFGTETDINFIFK